MRTLFFAADRAVRLREGVGEVITGFSVAPGPVEENEGLPGAWAVLFLRAVVQDPAGCESLLAHLTERSPSPSGITTPSAPGISCVSRLIPTAHTLAYLRFTARVTTNGARLTTGSGGLTLGRAGFAPAGRQTKFHGGIASSLSSSTSLAWSHRNQQVGGSSPPVGSNDSRHLRACPAKPIAGLTAT